MLSFNQILWWTLGLLLVPYLGITRAWHSVFSKLGGAYGCFLASCAVCWCMGIGYGVFLTWMP